MRAFGLLGMLALAGAAPGCGARTFSCSDNGGCGDDGRCEVDGWCSFPDAECPSGRRYAEFSGGGVAGSCVENVSQASSTGGPDLPGTDATDATGTSSSGDGVTSATESTTSTPPVESGGSETDTSTDASTTCSDGMCGTTGSAGSTNSTGSMESSSESTGDPKPPCPGFSDVFDGAAFDPSWQPYGEMGIGGHVMAQVDGELRWEFAPGIVEQRGLYRPFDGTVSSILVHATETTALAGAQAQTVLLFREEGGPGDLFLVWGNDTVQVRDDGVPVADSSIFEWVELRFEAGEVLVSTSSDGTEFELLTSIGSNFGAGGLQSIRIYGQTWTQAPAPATGAFGSIHVCEP